ncbi:hypothetical protein, partial [uncultured Faecalibacterium sp.]|uniref:hypothetical protein n=1 Tax=uncultured Faecalibacterium sp. TaxID=259315 RepID=UPI0025FF38E6
NRHNHITVFDETIFVSSMTLYQQAGLLSIQTPFLRCKMLVGLCPIPFILHRSDAGCAFFQNASIYIVFSISSNVAKFCSSTGAS